MERLTEYQETEGGIPFVVLKNNNGDPVQEAFQRLAAYEDTGYEPGQFETAMDAIKAHLWDVEQELKAYKYTGLTPAEIVLAWEMPLERLTEAIELIKAKDDGRLVVLPCKVGDTVYQVDHMTHSEALKSGVPQSEDHWQNRKYGRKRAKYLPLIVREKKMVKTLYPEIGKAVFLTRQAAETALKREADNG